MARLAGPLFYYELLRQTRKGRGHTLRVVYAVFVLAGIAWVYARTFGPGTLLHFSITQPTNWSLADRTGPESDGITQKQLADFADGLARAFLIMQTVAVTILTPACVAGAVAEERERRTLQLLFTTHLTAWEILTGKLYARLAPLGEMLLAGIPLLALLQLLGGVPITLAMGLFVATLAAMLCYGCLSLLASTMAPSVTSAIAMSYGMLVALLYSVYALSMLGLWHLASPATLLFRLEQAQLQTGGVNPTFVIHLTTFVAVHLLLALLSFLGAWRHLRADRGAAGTQRRAAQEEAWRSRPTAEPITAPVVVQVAQEPPPEVLEVTEADTPAIPMVTLAPDMPRRRRRRMPTYALSSVRETRQPPQEGQPLIWKEHTWGRLLPEFESIASIMFAIVAGGLLFLVLTCGGLVGMAGSMTGTGETYRRFAAGAASVVGIPLTLLLCLLTAYYATGCILKERTQKTWDALLTLPEDRSTILEAKLAGCFLCLKPLWSKALIFWAVAGVLFAVPLYAAPFLLLHIALVVLFLSVLGLWLSLRCRTLLQAQAQMGVWLVIQFVGLWPFGLSPLYTWIFLIFNADRNTLETFRLDAIGVIVSLLIWAALAGGLWLACVQRIRADVEA